MFYTIDKICRRSCDAALDPADQVCPDPRGENSSRDRSIETFHFQTNRLRVSDEVFAVQAGMIRKQQVVHLPKAVLFAGGLGHFRRGLGMRMHIRPWKMAKDESQFVREPIPDLLDDFIAFNTELAFISAVHQEGDGGGRAPLGVIVLADGAAQQIWPLRRLAGSLCRTYWALRIMASS